MTFNHQKCFLLFSAGSSLAVLLCLAIYMVTGFSASIPMVFLGSGLMAFIQSWEK